METAKTEEDVMVTCLNEEVCTECGADISAGHYMICSQYEN